MKLLYLFPAVFALLSSVQPAHADAFLFSNGGFTVLNVPGALPNTTVAEGINTSGQIVGYSGGAGAHQGFLEQNGVFTPIDVPGSPFTEALGINDSGEIVGLYYRGPTQTPQAFSYKNGVFSNLNDGVFSGANGINNAGVVIGSAGEGIESAFVDRNGNVTKIDLPFSDVLFSEGHGINNSGQLVGVYFTSGPNPVQGFLDTDGTFSSIIAPGNSLTYSYGINDLGQIVGYFQGPNGVHGYVDTNGVFAAIDVPGSFSTVANGINDSGQIVGTFNGSFALTPEPTSFLLAAVGLTLIFWPTVVIRRHSGDTITSKKIRE